MQADKQVSPALIREGRTGRQGNINILVTSQDDIKAEFFQLTTQNQGELQGVGFLAMPKKAGTYTITRVFAAMPRVQANGRYSMGRGSDGIYQRFNEGIDVELRNIREVLLAGDGEGKPDMDAVDFHLRGINVEHQTGILPGQNEFAPLITCDSLKTIGARPLSQQQIALAIDERQTGGRSPEYSTNQNQKNRERAK